MSATLVTPKTTSGGEIIRELVNASDGAGLHFDGEDGGINLGTSMPHLGSKYSLEFIVKGDARTGEVYLLDAFYDAPGTDPDKRLIFAWSGNTAGTIQLHINGTWMTGSFMDTPANGEVVHLVLSVDGTSATLYQNGNSVSTKTVGENTLTTTTGTHIGCSQNGSGNYFNGTIYRARFYNKALEPDEVQTAYERADVDYSSQYGSQTEKIGDAANRTFASGVGNWGAVAVTAANDSGALKIPQTAAFGGGTNNLASFAQRSYLGKDYFNTGGATENNKRYRLSFDAKAVTGGSKLYFNFQNNADTTNTALNESVTLTTSFVSYSVVLEGDFGSAPKFLLAGLDAAESFWLDNVSIVAVGCVSDYQTQWANPTQSLTVQDASGNADGTCSASGVSQVQPVVQLNSTSARIGTTAATPADGELLVSGNLGVGCDPAATLHANSSANGVNAIIENSTHNTQFLIKASAANKNSEILFGDSAADDVGKIDYDHNDNSLKLNTNSATRLTIDSSGNVSIAGSADPYSLSGDGAVNQLSVHATGTNKSASLNLASTGTGWNGISLGNETIRRAFVGTLNGSHLVFYTNNTNSGTTVAERMRISSTGHVSMTSSDADAQLTLTGTGTNAPAKIDLVPQGTGNARIQVGGSDKITIASTGLATFSNGIAFSQTDTSATGATATGTTLDHYEEGTWTPVPKDNQATVVATSTALGRYVRVGKIVTCTYRLVRNDTQSLTNTLYLYGLPFPSQNNVQTKNIGGGTSWFPNDTYAGFNYALENTDKWIIRKNDATGYATTNVWSNGQELIGTIIYEADA